MTNLRMPSSNTSKNIKLGSDEHSELSLGPIQNRMQYKKVLGFVKDCEKNGYKILTGRVPTEKGFFIEPTIIDKPPSDSLIITEEAFGEFLYSFHLPLSSPL